MKDNLLNRIQEREILLDSKLYEELQELKADNSKLVMELNSEYRTPKNVNTLLSKIIGEEIDESVTISLPFYTDYGKHTTLGKHIFINQNVMFVDLGGVIIEDHVLIGPMSRIISVNHIIDPRKRRGLYVKSVTIKKNAWLGANVTVLPGVTIGENSIVSADSTVTKDVPANVIVGGTPAKILKKIDIDNY